MPEELVQKLSIGFQGLRYPKDGQYIIPPVRGGNPLGMIGGQNLYVHEGMLKTFPGLEQILASPLGILDYRRILGIFPYIATGGTVYFVVCTAKKVYSYTAGAAAAVDITGALTFTGDNADYFDAEYWVDTGGGSYDPVIIMTNGVDDQFQWDGTGSCTAVGGTAPKARYLSNFSGHIFASYVLAGATYYHQRDYRSNIDDAADYAGGTAGAVDLRQSPGEIMGSVVFGEFRYIFKDNGISLCRATGIDPPFDYDQDFLPIGVIAPQTILKIWRHELCVFLGSDLDFYILRRDGAYDPIGESIALLIREYPNDETLKYSFAIYAPNIDHIILFVPTSNDSEAYCDTAFAFNLGEYLRSGNKMWSAPISIGVDMSAGTVGRFRSGYTIAQLGALYDTIGDIPGTIGSLFQDKTFSEVVLGDNNGYLWKLDENLETFPEYVGGPSVITGDNSDMDTVGNWQATVGEVHSIAGGSPGNCLRVRNNTGGAAQATTRLWIPILLLSGLTPGRTYSLLVRIKNDGVMTEDVEAYFDSVAEEVVATLATTSEWVAHEIIFKAVNANKGIYFRAESNIQDTEYFLIDTVTLQDVTFVHNAIPWEADLGALQLAENRGDNFRLEEHEIDYRDGSGALFTNKIFDDDLAKVHEVTISGTGKVALLEQRFWGTEEGRF